MYYYWVVQLVHSPMNIFEISSSLGGGFIFILLNCCIIHANEVLPEEFRMEIF